MSPNQRHRVRYLGLIPARAGSKGIPGKNTADLGGRPLVEWTIAAAQASRRLDSYLVSTDDPAVIKSAARMGAPVPFVRPDALATDTAASIDVALHALDWLQANDCDVDTLVLLQPTCPFRTAIDIDSAIDQFERVGATSLISVSPPVQHPCDMVARTPHGLRRAVDPYDNTGRQSFPDFLFMDGAIYITRTDFLREQRTFWDAASATHIIPVSHAVDIDDPYQLRLARGLLLTEDRA